MEIAPFQQPGLIVLEWPLRFLVEPGRHVRTDKLSLLLFGERVVPSIGGAEPDLLIEPVGFGGDDPELEEFILAVACFPLFHLRPMAYIRDVAGKSSVDGLHLRNALSLLRPGKEFAADGEGKRYEQCHYAHDNQNFEEGEARLEPARTICPFGERLAHMGSRERY